MYKIRPRTTRTTVLNFCIIDALHVRFEKKAANVPIFLYFLASGVCENKEGICRRVGKTRIYQSFATKYIVLQKAQQLFPALTGQRSE